MLSRFFSGPPLAPGQAPIDLGQTPETLKLTFGQGRGTATDEALITTKSAPPSRLEVDATGLRGTGGTIDGSDVSVRARVLRGTIVLDACLDLRKTGPVSAGVYQGRVIFTDPRVNDLTIPITSTIQSRALAYLAPLVLLMPLFGLWLVWEGASHDEKTRFGAGALAAFVLAFSATAVVYGAQGISNPGWGGLLSFGALVAAMYTAATGAAATFITRATKENPPPP